MKVEFIKDCVCAFGRFSKGDVAEFPEDYAEKLTELKQCKKASEKKSTGPDENK